MTDEAATSPPEALTIDSWQIWHVYSTYLPKPIENIHQAAADLVEANLVDADEIESIAPRTFVNDRRMSISRGLVRVTSVVEILSRTRSNQEVLQPLAQKWRKTPQRGE